MRSNTLGVSGTPAISGHNLSYTLDGQRITDCTTRFFENYEAGMDGWDTELGFKPPRNAGPEIRLFGGYYDCHNPVGDDVEGLKAGLELKTGLYLAFDAGVFEDDNLKGSDWLVGERILVPLTANLNLRDFAGGLVSMRRRTLDERMRSEMAMRDVRVQTKEKGFKENEAKRQVASNTSVSTRIKTSVKTVTEGTPRALSPLAACILLIRTTQPRPKRTAMAPTSIPGQVSARPSKKQARTKTFAPMSRITA